MTRALAVIIAATVTCGVWAGRQTSPGDPRFARFVDRTKDVGLAIGDDAACWADVDNDGWTDLCASGGVWRNESGKRLSRIADVGSGVVAADYDNDGWTDLFSWVALKLYHNEGGARFAEAALPAMPPTVSRGACWGDFDNDSFVDLYIGGYEDWDRDITYPDVILHNVRGKGFELQWTETRYRARGVTACDFNRDGALDVYVSNYRLQPNLLWLNDGRGRFRDAAAELNAAATSAGFPGGHSIGACWGDFDADGEMDLFAGNFAHVDDRGDQPKSRFLRNTGKAGGYRFDDKGTCGVFYQESYASPAAGDVDNDGRLDLYFTTVYPVASFGRPNRPVLFANDSGWSFRDVTAQSGIPALGATSQAAWADFNRDGRLDLVTDGKLFVNEGGGNHWLEVRLWGDAKKVNRSAIGAQARIRLKDRTVTRQVEAGVGEGNQNDMTLHFGLGDKRGTVDLEITWPSGGIQRVRLAGVDRLVEIGPRPRVTKVR